MHTLRALSLQRLHPFASQVRRMGYDGRRNLMGTGQGKPPSIGDAQGPPDAEPSAPRWSPLGEHRYYVDGDMLVIETSGGEFSMADGELFMQAVEAVQGRHGYHLLLADATRGVTLPAAVRRSFVEWTAKYRIHPAVAVVGAGLATRAVASLTMNAMRLFGSPTHNVEFFAELAAGRNWLRSQRPKLMQRLSL